MTAGFSGLAKRGHVDAVGRHQNRRFEPRRTRVIRDAGTMVTAETDRKRAEGALEVNPAVPTKQALQLTKLEGLLSSKTCPATA